VAWTKDGLSTDVPTPAATDGKLYLASDRGAVVCLDIQTGEEFWLGKVTSESATISSSPVVVDGKVYVTSEVGTTYVLALGDEFKLMAANELGEFTLATPVFTRNRILIRTFENLYCIGK